jgi:hypothetical protein
MVAKSGSEFVARRKWMLLKARKVIEKGMVCENAFLCYDLPLSQTR